MNIAFRKLGLLEAKLIKQEEEARIMGYSSCPVDKELREKVTSLMEKVKY